MAIFPLLTSLRGAPGEVLTEQGGAGDTMYFIMRGEVMVLVGTKIVAEMEDGDVFGEMSVLTGRRRTASCVCKTFCELYVLERNDLQRVLLNFPGMAETLKQKAEEMAASRSKAAATVNYELNPNQVASFGRSKVHAEPVITRLTPRAFLPRMDSFKSENCSMSPRTVTELAACPSVSEEQWGNGSSTPTSLPGGVNDPPIILPAKPPDTLSIKPSDTLSLKPLTSPGSRDVVRGAQTRDLVDAAGITDHRASCDAAFGASADKDLNSETSRGLFPQPTAAQPQPKALADDIISLVANLQRDENVANLLRAGQLMGGSGGRAASTLTSHLDAISSRANQLLQQLDQT